MRVGARSRVPARRPSSVVLPREVVARHVDSKALYAFLMALSKLHERRLASEMEAAKQAAIRQELARLARLSEFERQVEAARLHVEENLLTLKCPRPACGQAFVDFSNCFALQCHRCGCGFCAWCLADCGADAHAHVANCPQNRHPQRAVYADLSLFDMCQKERRERGIRRFLCTLNEDVNTAVRASMRHAFLLVDLHL